MEKRCTKCGQLKPLAEFSKHNKTRDGLNLWCRACVSESHRRYHVANRDTRNAKTREWREQNKEHRREYERARRADVEQARARDRQKYYADVERSRETARRWRANHAEQVSEINRRSYAMAATQSIQESNAGATSSCTGERKRRKLHYRGMGCALLTLRLSVLTLRPAQASYCRSRDPTLEGRYKYNRQHSAALFIL